MTDDQDQPVDLGPMKAELERRALGLTSRVLEQIGAARARAQTREAVREGVERRLARFAWPGAVAAALSMLAILATRNDHQPDQQAELFTVMVMGQTPAAKWVALGQAPEIQELLQAMQGR